MSPQSTTPLQYLLRPDKSQLCQAYAHQSLDALRTPAFIIDRTIFAENCAKMHRNAKEWGASFRAHLKTHKTVEGTRLQLNSSEGHTNAVVVSTMMEAWELVQAGLVKDGTVKDILYGLPVALNKIADMASISDALSASGGIFRVLIDHPDQVRALEEYEMNQGGSRRWSAFVKINGGQNRAGVIPSSADFKELMQKLFSSSVVSVYGFYAHAGNSYASTSLSEASSFLSAEVQCVVLAARLAKEVASTMPDLPSFQEPFVLSVGSTPTAHAASPETRQKLTEALNGTLELHAGNYPMLDLQQEHTGMVNELQIAQRVKATVVSIYPGRGAKGEDEALIDAGAIAFSKDGGPSGGYGRVMGKPWQLARISQEHGILLRVSDQEENSDLKLGETVEIIGQHACLIAAAYPWYYIVDKNADEGRTVVDMWVPWKGW
ncbi:hypothetical protein AMATHDRAFT_72249 [Amanita thiersii Skay4041]|uniref:D-serine dehydratase n=1 Tax=Amanita thiersii Skay4041 TaxID=703135 RepID=A0A2A9P195_9AGAR|nr:hypothetical protein AMATHDRAFT_72249 [Amanita thiersii Skay4041]